MQKDLRIGAVGTSAIMEYIQQGIRLTDGISCRVICSRDEARARAFAEKNGIPDFTGSLDALLADPELDIIYLASPNALHPAQAIRAMEAGKHVFVEKPAAVRACDLLAMKEAADRNHVFFFECITTIFMPNFLIWKQLLPELGKIRTAEMNYGKYSSRYDAYLRGENPNIFNPEMAGGALNDLGVYAVHGAVSLFGAPRSVSYIPQRGPNGIDLSGVLTLTYDGFSCVIRSAKDRDLESGCRITGDNGELISCGQLNSLANCTVRMAGAPERHLLNEPEHRMTAEFSRFRDAIRCRDREFFDAMTRQSLLTASVLEQAHKSAEGL